MTWLLRHSYLFSRGHRQLMSLNFACLPPQQVVDHGPCVGNGATGVWVFVGCDGYEVGG